MGKNKKNKKPNTPTPITGEAFDRAPKLEMGVYWGSGCYPQPFTKKQWKEIDRRRRAYEAGKMDDEGNIIPPEK